MRRLVLALLLAAGGAQAPLAAQPTVALAPLAPGETLLEVAVRGEARVAPDRIGLTGGVVTTGATAREALEANTRQMTAVVAALRAAGVRDNEIQTRQISVQPRFEQLRDQVQQPRIIGYVAQNSVAVATTRIALAPRLIEAMFGAGANSVAGPAFSLDDDRAAVAAARRDAVAQALAEAEAYAAAFGRRVVRLVRVSERSRNTQDTDIVVTGSRIARANFASPSTPVEPGEITQTVNLSVDFALAPR